MMSSVNRVVVLFPGHQQLFPFPYGNQGSMRGYDFSIKNIMINKVVGLFA